MVYGYRVRVAPSAYITTAHPTCTYDDLAGVGNDQHGAQGWERPSQPQQVRVPESALLLRLGLRGGGMWFTFYRPKFSSHSRTTSRYTRCPPLIAAVMLTTRPLWPGVLQGRQPGHELHAAGACI